MSELDMVSAMKVAQRRIDELALITGDRFEILLDQTREAESGWVFFFNTEEYCRTQNAISALVGNGPILVTRAGLIYELSSAEPWEAQVTRLADKGFNSQA